MRLADLFRENELLRAELYFSSHIESQVEEKQKALISMLGVVFATLTTYASSNLFFLNENSAGFYEELVKNFPQYCNRQESVLTDYSMYAMLPEIKERVTSKSDDELNRENTDLKEKLKPHRLFVERMTNTIISLEKILERAISFIKKNSGSNINEKRIHKARCILTEMQRIYPVKKSSPVSKLTHKQDSRKLTTDAETQTFFTCAAPCHFICPEDERYDSQKHGIRVCDAGVVGPQPFLR